MRRTLSISEQAKAGLLEIEDYIDAEFGETALLAFQAAYERLVGQIRLYPFLGKQIKIRNGALHARIVNRYTTIFYTVTETEIVLQFVLDNRQDWQTRIGIIV